MKKVLIMVLSLVLAFGVLSGCSVTPKTEITEAQKIAELKELLITTTEGSLIGEGGFKLTRTEGKDKTINYGKKDGEKSIVKTVKISETGEELSPFYIVEGFEIGEVTGGYKLGNYRGTEVPVIETFIQILFMPIFETTLTETAVDKTLRIVGNKGIDTNATFYGAEFKYTPDKKLKSISIEERNTLDKIEIAIEIGEQSFIVPTAILALNIDPILRKSQLAVEKALLNGLKDALSDTQNIKITSKMGDEENAMYLTSEYAISDAEYVNKDGVYSIVKKGNSNDAKQVVEFLHMPYMLSMSKCMVAGIWINTALTIFDTTNSTNETPVLAYTASGNTVTISRGENKKIVLENGKIKQVNAEVAFAGAVFKTSITYAYGEGAATVPTDIATFIVTEAHKATLKLYKRSEKMNHYEFQKAKGVNIVITGETVGEVKMDLSGLMDKGISVIDEETTYLYSDSNYSITDGIVSEEREMIYYTFLDMNNLINQYGSLDIFSIETTATTVIFKDNGVASIVLTISDGEKVTKLEFLRNGVVYTTANYTYGAQTVEIPKAIVDYCATYN